jgi:hypothetical protein
MQNKLVIALIVAAWAFASGTAPAAEMPSYGSKNFDPPADAPSYFTNENGRDADRGLETAAIDTNAEETTGELPADVGPIRTVRTKGGHHGKYSASSRHASGRTRSQQASTDAMGPAAGQFGSAHKRSESGNAKVSSSTTAVSTAKTRTAKPGRANPRRAAEAATAGSLAGEA